jgi:uncharacterized protein YabE (DUF348 family)
MRKVLFIIVLIIFFGGGFWYWLLARTENNRELFTGQQDIEIIEDGIMVLGIRTEAKTVGEFVGQIELNLKAGDKIYPSKETQLVGATRIIVERAIPIKIEVDGKTIEKNVFTKNIKDTLRESGVTLNPSDKVEPALREGIFENIEIIVTRIDHKEITETEDIDFKVMEKKDKDLKWRTKKVKQKGKKGEKEVKYLVTYKNGKEIKRKKLSTEIVKEPVDEVTVVGTKIKVGKKQRGRASWYAYTGKMAAASITFPKGTWLRVTAVNSGRQVFVVINDYGPAAYTGKILDLDKEAFKKLAPLGAGVIEVKIEEIK